MVAIGTVRRHIHRYAFAQPVIGGGSRPSDVCDRHDALCSLSDGAEPPSLPGMTGGEAARDRGRRPFARAGARNVAQGLLRRQGYRLSRYEDPPMRRLIHDLEVTHVLDVGANVGQFAERVRMEGGFGGRIDSFEPVGASFRSLTEARVGDAHWHGHRLALSDQSGSVEINVYNVSVLNSLSDITAAGRSVFNRFHDLRQIGVETVATRPLDEVDLPDLGPAFLKIDTQGHDWAVMDGASVILRRVALLSMELSFDQLYESATPAWQSLERLHDLGFGLAALEYVVRASGNAHQIGEADGLFVRRETA